MFSSVLKRTITLSRCQAAIKRIVDLKANEKSILIKGWISSLRKMKENLFVDVVDGSSFRPLQVVIEKSRAPADLHYGCSVEVRGDLIENKNAQLEMTNSDVTIIGGCSLEDGFPFAPKKTYSNDYVRQFLHFRPKYPAFNSLLRVRDEATCAVYDFFKDNGYVNVHAPILTANDCEGAGEVFVVDKPQVGKMRASETPCRFFDDEAYLSVSGQMHLEIAARGLSQVFCLGPTFRAENSKSRLHLSEFYMLEAETTTLTDLDELTDSVQNLIHYVASRVATNCADDVAHCRKTLGDPSLAEALKNVDDLLTSPFGSMSYDEAAMIILQNKDQLKTRFVSGGNFTKEQELFLVKHNGNVPLFIVNWPKRIKPFYMKASDEDENKVLAFDLLCPNVGEVAGGSFREDDYDKLQSALRKMKLINSLDWYLELRKFGNVTTCGYGLGFERLLLVLLQMLNIKDVIPFPRFPHNCKL